MKNGASDVTVITGGSSGLGLAMAQNLAKRGHRLVLLARAPEHLEAALASLRQDSPSAIGLSCDVRSHEDLEAAATTIRDTFGQIDFLILNAGVVHVNRLQDLSVTEIREILETDLMGVILSAHALTPLLAPGGRILIVSSGFGLMGAAGYSVYCGAKAGVINFAAAFRRELLVRKIRLYVTCPSDIDTPQYRAEQTSLPEWMSLAGARGRPMPVDSAAEKILRKCTGGRFLILINFEVRVLGWANRLLPIRWTNWLLDRLFPRPTT